VKYCLRLFTSENDSIRGKNLVKVDSIQNTIILRTLSSFFWSKQC